MKQRTAGRVSLCLLDDLFLIVTEEHRICEPFRIWAQGGNARAFALALRTLQDADNVELNAGLADPADRRDQHLAPIGAVERRVDGAEVGHDEAIKPRYAIPGRQGCLASSSDSNAGSASPQVTDVCMAKRSYRTVMCSCWKKPGRPMCSR